MQHPILTVHPGGVTDQADRRRRAWRCVAEGFERGISELACDDPEFAGMQQCFRAARTRAGLPPLVAVRSTGR